MKNKKQDKLTLICKYIMLSLVMWAITCYTCKQATFFKAFGSGELNALDFTTFLTFVKQDYIGLFMFISVVFERYFKWKANNLLLSEFHFSVTLFLGLIYENTRFRALFFTCNIYFNPASFI